MSHEVRVQTELCDESVLGTFNFQNWIGIKRIFIDTAKIKFLNFGKRNVLNVFNVGDPLTVRRLRLDSPRLDYSYVIIRFPPLRYIYGFHAHLCLVAK